MGETEQQAYNTLVMLVVGVVLMEVVEVVVMHLLIQTNIMLVQVLMVF